MTYRLDTTYTEATNRYLIETPDMRRTTADQVALNFGFANSTLRRKLSHEGSCFVKMRTSERKRRCAKALLKNPTLTADQMAPIVGVSAREAFYRMVRDWTGEPYSTLKAYSSPTHLYSMLELL